MNGVLERIKAAKVVGVLRAESAARGLELAEASLQGGLGALEVTFTTPGADGLIRTLVRDHPDALIGAGTVLSVPQAEAAVAAGARFLVSPQLGEEVLAFASGRGIPYIPGVLTPTEVGRALSLGAAVLKLFPAARAGGTAYLKDLFGPFPDLQVMVTGGVGAGEVADYLRAGAVAVGLGSLFTGTADEVRARTDALMRSLADGSAA